MSSVGELIDEIAAVDDEMDRIKVTVKKLNEQRSALEIRLMKVLKKQKLNKASGELAHAALGSQRHASIKDLAKLIKYIKAKNAFDLFQRRINSKSYFDRLANGEEVPGVDIFERQVVKITRKRG